MYLFLTQLVSLNRTKARENIPDIIVMDIFMPKMDGYTALYMLKNCATTNNIPVIMITGVSYEFNELLADRYGADTFMTKPVNSTELLNVISNLLPSPKTVV